MGILIGMDEAGYGPNYGPLVVAATAWQVPDEGSGFRVQSSDGYSHCPAPHLASAPTPNLPSTTATHSIRQSSICNRKSNIASPPDLYRLLRVVVAKKPSTRRIAIADSKKLYAPGHGLRQLERGLHAVLRSMRQPLSRWSAFVEYCQADRDNHHKTACWPDGFDAALPVDATVDDLDRLSARFARACEATEVLPLLIRARLIYPAQFNDLVARHGSKGAALSHITVGLLREVMDAICPPAEAGSPPPALSPQPPVSAVCDKHGGRNFYAAILQHHFSEHWIEPLHESRAESRYEWGPPESRVSVAFRMNGERFLPTALASMTAKYLRELSMRAFNEFWRTRVPDLRPTAGYSKDAQRFRQAIAAAQRELRIDDHAIWRNR